jgi:hypothetical protein
MKIKSVIKKVLREEYIPTETSYLGWDVPKELYDELESIGVKIYDIYYDKIYIAEIQFDTESVVFEVMYSEHDDDSDYYVHKIKDLPRKVKIYLIRRFENRWSNYMGK